MFSSKSEHTPCGMGNICYFLSNTGSDIGTHIYHDKASGTGGNFFVYCSM